MQPIPVVCDRCRAEGESGADPFEAFGALLDFEPVPRRAKRADGWDAELQRAFIALLSLTGSVKSACRAIGKSEFGITQLVRAEGCEGFVAAMDEAVAISKDERSRRLAEAVRAVAADKDAWSPPRPAWSKAATRDASSGPARKGRHDPPLPPGDERRDELGYTAEERQKVEALTPVFHHYMLRLEMEREARLAGKICEADFYVRQITVLELAMQLMIGGHGRDAIIAIQKLRLGPHKLISIAETAMTRLLDDARRALWAIHGEPERPPPLRPEQMIDKGDVKLLKLEAFYGPDVEAQMRAKDEEYAAAAKEQVEWERKARAEAAAWAERVEEEEAEPPESSERSAQRS
ncbi:MAG TPA: hypothetical protein VD887_00705 [Allosphingosinicella sp.]|nr:hypothetical protein [Allosphingosinicella sp.]